jgi:hypothetical protein
LLGSDRNRKEAMDQEQKEKLKEERGLGSKEKRGKRTYSQNPPVLFQLVHQDT